MRPTDLFPPAKELTAIRYGKPVLLLGSCFSTHLNDRLRDAGFQVGSNPFGTIFHPIPLARFILDTLTDEPLEERTFQRDDVWLSWDASSEVYAMSEEALKAKLLDIRQKFRQQLETAQLLVVTVGSAHGYRLHPGELIVANCHKMPGTSFRKELTTTENLLAAWEKVIPLLQRTYPQLQIVFTVSPVRYSRDGWTENNRSKARLFELTEQLQQRFFIGYFPAFELINDVLRDYRYFETDGVHPNQQAVDEVWELFREWFMEPVTQQLVKEMESLRQMAAHRLLFPESVKSKEFLAAFQRKRESFLSLHPSIEW